MAGTNLLVDCGDGVMLERGVACRLQDGTVLRSDHYYPPGGGKQPTLLMRQPYGRDIASTVVYAHPIWFARRGYNVVIQDVRGRGGSEGEFYPFRNEGRDGAETIAWLRMRPECNGRVGMYGFSYQGMTQLLAAAEQPEGLECIAPAMTACDLYAGWFYHNGALRLASSLGWGVQMLKEDAVRRGLHEGRAKLEAAWTNLRAQTWFMPYGEHPVITDPELPSYVRDWFEHDVPGEYWSSMDVSARASDIRVPALHVSGWYDTYLQGSVLGFELLRTQAGSNHARDNQYLLAGPWVHIPWGDRVGECDLGAEARLDTDELLLRWFDHWLKDADTFANEPKVRHFAMGVNRWLAADDWRGDATMSLYLHSGGRAESRKGDGGLSTVKAADEPSDIFVYDPEVPVMSPGGAQGVSGPTDQAVLEMGNNLLVYTGEPLGDALHVFGAPKVTLYAATSASHADFVAKLVRVLPGGRAEFVCMGIARSSALFGDEYQADSVHVWEFELEPTSTVFAVGERVRLEIAGCAFPLYDRSSSNETKPRDMTPFNWGRSTHCVFHDEARPSRLSLQVIA
ncbi:CocE/NonD family hydrolase [Granulicella sp. 5B5]|uniref:CocE/NonD family hydrolase n=1 Tax=Granulicella sp. 5B5 TaxID=1617967 RepID=UPI0015F5543D|nr:CocE/NonD family hydrolase [Granulicella sp. 5B5]QMV19467.1 CocE/NonD family hydrolase [Granulicella sp. 5B5]